MSKLRENIFLLIKIMLAVMLCGFCLLKTRFVSQAVSEAVMRCLTTIIPSLYAMMIVSGFLVKSGIINIFSRISSFFGRFFFGMENDVFPVFSFSMFAGYPTGAKMLCEEYEKGLISKRRAEIFCGLCFGAGSAFIFGCISGQLYGSDIAGKIILISGISANVLLAFAISPFMRKSCPNEKSDSKIKITPEMLNESILGGGHSMMNICIMITAFSVITAFLRYFGITSIIGGLISYITGLSSDISDNIVSAILDVTAVSGFPTDDYTLLPYLSGLVSFGGICVIFQVYSVVSGKLSVKPLIAMRLAAALTSGIICRFIMPFMLKQETVFTSKISIHGYSSCSPIPSILLIVMTLMLFVEHEKLEKNKNLSL